MLIRLSANPHCIASWEAIVMKKVFWLFLLAVIPPDLYSADESTIDRSDIRRGQKAVLLEDYKPNYPSQQIRLAGEGWVVLYYNINELGLPVDVIPAEFAGPQKFVETAIAALKKWRYKPATSAGVPVSQYGNQVLFRFMHEGANRILGRRRLDLAKEIRAQIAAGQVVSAREALDKEFASNLNVYEISMFNVLRADLAQSLKNYSEEIIYLQRARRAGEMLSDKANRAILARAYIAAARAADVDTGIESFELLQQTKGQIKDWAKYEDIYRQLVALRDSQQPLAIHGVIVNDGVGPTGMWMKQLRRHAFEFNGINGDLAKFELRCTQSFFTATVDRSRSWQVPASWGDCMLLVFGSVGASFTLVELPNQATEALDAEAKR